jgi:hypothetical protein
MRKIIVLLSIMFIFSACSRNYNNEFELVYDVYYPTETYTYVEKLKGGENSSYIISTRKGSNYLYFSNGNFFTKKDILYNGTAPFRVVSFKRIK